MIKHFKKLIVVLFVFFSMTSCESIIDNSISIQNIIERLNEEGYDLMAKGESENALKKFEEALLLDSSNDTILNNASWASYSSFNFKKALDYSEKSIANGINSAEEYINYGNALSEFEEYDKAIKQYTEAIRVNPEEYLGFYGRAISHLDNNDLIKSLEDFEDTLRLVPNDLDAQRYKLYILAELGKLDESYEFLSESFDIEYSYEYLESLYELTSYADDYSKHIKCLEAIRKKYKDNGLIEFHYAKAYYLEGKYNHSLLLFKKYSRKNRSDVYGYLWTLYNLTELNKFDEAKIIVDDTLNNLNKFSNEETAEAYNAIGNFFFYISEYEDAIFYYKKSSSMANVVIYKTNYIETLIITNRHELALEQSLSTLKDFPDDIELLEKLSRIYFELGENKKSIEICDRVLKLSSDYMSAYTRKCYLYIQDGEYEKANEVVSLALSIDPENVYILDIKDDLKKKKDHTVIQIEEAFNNYYLYNDYDINKLEKYKSYNKLSDNDYFNLIEGVRKEGDIYTYIISGDYYEELKLDSSSTVYYESIDDETLYIGISNFGSKTAIEFVSALDSITDHEEKHLIIDLRGNYGGSTNSANRILDMLLDECITSSLVYKDNSSYDYYSKESSIDFDKISIFIDNDTASASELLTLSLKTYLDNVTVYGKTSYGKGVGQDVFDDANNRTLLYIVSHKWNVNNINVSRNKIKPDVYVSGYTFEDYLKSIK